MIPTLICHCPCTKEWGEVWSLHQPPFYPFCWLVKKTKQAPIPKPWKPGGYLCLPLQFLWSLAYCPQGSLVAWLFGVKIGGGNCEWKYHTEAEGFLDQMLSQARQCPTLCRMFKWIIFHLGMKCVANWRIAFKVLKWEAGEKSFPSLPEMGSLTES